MPNTYPAADDENPEHLRHKSPIPYQPDTIYQDPGRWYRINVNYIPELVALCDYYTHADAHEGTESEKEYAAQQWIELQFYLMTGITDQEGEGMTGGNDFCEMIAQCIDSGNLNLTMQNQFNTTVNQYAPDEIIPDAGSATNSVVETCDRDALFAAMRQMIDWIDELNGMLLDQLSSSLNWIETIGRVISSFPLIGSGSLDEQLISIAEYFEDVAVGYNASFTQDIRESYYCDLFCIAVSTCSINASTIRTYFWERFMGSWDDDTLLRIFDALISLGTVGPHIVHAMYFITFLCLSKGYAALGIEPAQFTAIMKALSNDSDPDWEILCTECPAHAYLSFDFPDSPYDWTPFGDNAGSFESGEGLTCYGHPTTSTQGVQYEWPLGDAYPVTKIRLEVVVKGGDVTTVSRPVWITALTDQGVVETVQWFKANYGTTREINIELYDCPDCRIIQVGAKVGSSNEGSYVKVRAVRVWMDTECPEGWDAFCADVG